MLASHSTGSRPPKPLRAEADLVCLGIAPIASMLELAWTEDSALQRCSTSAAARANSETGAETIVWLPLQDGTALRLNGNGARSAALEWKECE